MRQHIVILMLAGIVSVGCNQQVRRLQPDTPIISVTADARSYAFITAPDGKVRIEKSDHSFKPGVSIYPSGRVVIIKGNATEHRTTIVRQTMKALQGAFRQPGFLSITPEAVQKKMEAVDAATRTGFGVEDGGYWTFSVYRGSSNHTFTVYAPFAFARHYTTIDELRILTNLIMLTYVSAGMKQIE